MFTFRRSVITLLRNQIKTITIHNVPNAYAQFEMIRCFPTFLSGFVSANLDSFANLLDNFGRFRCRCQLFLTDPGAAVTPESHKSFGFYYL